MKRFLAIAWGMIAVARAEDVSILIETTGSQFSDSAPININEGDSASLEFVGVSNLQNWSFSMFCTIGGKQIALPCTKAGATDHPKKPDQDGRPDYDFLPRRHSIGEASRDPQKHARRDCQPAGRHSAGSGHHLVRHS